MARLNYNVVMHGASGRVGDLLTFIQRNGKTYIGKIRTNTGQLSPEQQAVRDKFPLAAKYAKACMKDAVIKALYKQRAGGGVSPYNLAVADYWTPPVVESIDTLNYSGAVGSTIQVHATDDTKVTEVQVKITSAGGALLEEGLAVLNAETESWHYTATVVNAVVSGSKITVVAKDLPGNATEGETVL